MDLVTDFNNAIKDDKLMPAATALKSDPQHKLAQQEITQWLVNWISKGQVDTRTAEVNKFLSENFQARLGLPSTSDISGIRDAVDAQTKVLATNLEQFSNAGANLLTGRQPVELQAMRAAMKEVEPARRNIKASDVKMTDGEQNLRFSELMTQVMNESGIRFRPGEDPELAQAKYQELSAKMVEALREHADEFSPQFFRKTDTALKQLESDSLNIFIPLANNSQLLDKLSDAKVQTELFGEELVQKTNQELADTIGEENYRATVYKVAAKLGPYLKSGDPEAVNYAAVEIQKMEDPKEKAAALIKLREAKEVGDLQKKLGAKSLGDFISGKNTMQLLTGIGLGVIGGGLFGMPGLGALAMTLFAFLGKAEESTAGLVSFAQAKAEQKSPPAARAAAA